MKIIQQYFSNAAGSVDYLPEEGYLYLYWTGAPVSSDEFRGLHAHAHHLLRQLALTGMLADYRALPIMLPLADQQWLVEEWLPKVVSDTPLRRYAALPAPEPSRRLHSWPVLVRVQHWLAATLFEDVSAAEAWLVQPVPPLVPAHAHEASRR